MTPNDRIDPLNSRRPAYRRYWDTYNRPYSGCGCLWIIIIILFIWWIATWASGGGGYWGWGGHHGTRGVNPPAASAPPR